jgi:mannosyltransferase OCH1-like enzyme
VYSGLKTAVERSDLWRYVVMCKHGGVYTDADTLCVRPIQVRICLSLHEATQSYAAASATAILFKVFHEAGCVERSTLLQRAFAYKL